ncbi:MAG TPA: hypothetical protein VED87_10515 [Methylocystis sp.]|nr:hypothetical protein [Methylocystis sp.]
MRGFLDQMRALVLCACLAPVVALAAFVAAAPAAAQGAYPPYGYDPYDDYPPRSALGPGRPFHPPVLRGYVARVLARRGYQLVGPLRDEGDEIVAAGVDASGRRMKFLIDAYEGEVLRSWPIGPAEAYGEPGLGRAYAPRDFGDERGPGYFGPPIRRPDAARRGYEGSKEPVWSPRTAHPAERTPPEPRRSDSARLAPHSPPQKPTAAAPAVAAAPPPPHKPKIDPPPVSSKPPPVAGAPTPLPAPVQPKAASAPVNGGDGTRDRSLAKTQPKQSVLPGIENEATPKANVAQ